MLCLRGGPMEPHGPLELHGGPWASWSPMGPMSPMGPCPPPPRGLWTPGGYGPRGAA